MALKYDKQQRENQSFLIYWNSWIDLNSSIFSKAHFFAHLLIILYSNNFVLAHF